MQCQKIPGAEHGLFPDAKPKFNNFDMLKGGWVQEEKKKKKTDTQAAANTCGCSTARRSGARQLSGINSTLHWFPNVSFVNFNNKRSN